jgi:OOP family OmpA-OmpF porin
MPRSAKFLIGLAAALLAGWIGHGPLGRGEAFVGGLEARARAVLGEAELSGVQVRFGRDPLSREAVLSGQANEFQREGQGQFPGINDRIRAVSGVSGVRWEETACCANPEAGNAAAR